MFIHICVDMMFENQGDGSAEDSDDDSSSAMQNKSFMKWIVFNCNLAVYGGSSDYP